MVGKGTRHREEHWSDTRQNKNLYLARLVALTIAEHGFVPTRRLHDDLTNDEACTLEISTIAQIGRHPNGPLVNLTDGGVGGPMPLEARVKHSQRMRGRPAPNKGKPMSAEQRAKCEHTFLKPGGTPWNKGVPMAEEQRQGLIGHPVSAEARELMSLAKKGKPPPNKGKPMPSHQVEAMRQRRIGAKHSEATRQKMSESQRARYETPGAHAAKSVAAHKAWATRRSAQPPVTD
jgi:hypothetical protein